MSELGWFSTNTTPSLAPLLHLRPLKSAIELKTALSVFIILFTFQITGTIKNMILVFLANRKLDVVGHSMTEEVESSLSDTNA